MRALLIEDDATFAGTVSRGLQEEFIDVDIANTAEAGGELARGRHYDVIVLDWASRTGMDRACAEGSGQARS
jgi:DNA-binding response OmpR family regulator